jgi:aminoglycoside 2''-phosphotransferase
MDTKSVYLRTIKDAYPDLDIMSAHLQTPAGQFSDILLTDHDLAFRFPRYAEHIPAFRDAMRLLEKLQGHLPLPIPDPIYTSHAAHEPGKVFMGYKFIPGHPLEWKILADIKDRSILQSFARQLADFLAVLHRLMPSTFDLNFPVIDMASQTRILYTEARQHLFPLMRSDARQGLTEHFEHYLITPALQRYQPSVIHGDFGGSNILFLDDRITGILDFSFTGYGDSALDLAAISTYGEPFFSMFCQFYPVTEPMLARAEFYRGTFALEEALHGWKYHDQEAFDSGMEQYV